MIFGEHAHILGIVFWPFLANMTEIFHGSSGDCYRSIGIIWEIQVMIFIFHFWHHFWVFRPLRIWKLQCPASDTYCCCTTDIEEKVSREQANDGCSNDWHVCSERYDLRYNSNFLTCWKFMIVWNLNHKGIGYFFSWFLVQLII